MFVDAIETAIRYTRPIHFIARNYGSDAVIPGTATLFFINAQGWAFTCRHVAQQLVSAEQVMAQYTSFRTEIAMVPRGGSAVQHRRELERKYGYSRQTTVEIRQAFVNCVIGRLNVDVVSHPTIDMALLHFRDFDALACDWFPTFPAITTGLKQAIPLPPGLPISGVHQLRIRQGQGHNRVDEQRQAGHTAIPVGRHVDALSGR